MRKLTAPIIGEKGIDLNIDNVELKRIILTLSAAYNGENLLRIRQELAIGITGIKVFEISPGEMNDIDNENKVETCSAIFNKVYISKIIRELKEKGIIYISSKNNKGIKFCYKLECTLKQGGEIEKTVGEIKEAAKRRIETTPKK